MAQKYLILDSGALINITLNGLVEAFKELSTVFQGEFLITDAVKYETIEHPMNIKKFEWGAIRIGHLLEEEILKSAEDEELATQKHIEKRAGEVINLANNSFFVDGKSIHLIEQGEAEAMALSLILTENGIQNAVVIDERTARMLCENTENLKKLMEQKLRVNIKTKTENLEQFKKIKIIRSTELMYIANKRGLIDGDKRSLEAVLYALKFNGCSISEKEIQAMKAI